MKELAVLERVLKTISRYNMMPPGSRIVAAVSGGADSVCLAHLLRERLTGIAHVNHKLRGQESEEDEQFAAELAQQLELPFYRTTAVLEPGNLEQAARRARRDFFHGLIRNGVADRVATGHTRDDQAETVLFRVLRGSGLEGLAGIYPVTAEGLVRPLLELGRDEIREFLRTRAIAWREDSSNADLRFARNRIRQELMPLLRAEWNPRVDEALARLGDLAHGEIRHGKAGGLPVLDLEIRSLGIGEARRAVREAIRRVKGDLTRIEYQHIEQVLNLTSGKLHLPGVEVIRSFDWIRIARPTPQPRVEAVAVEVPGHYDSPDGCSRILIEKADRSSCVNLRTELSWGRISAPIELRGWRAGDHYRPVGQPRDRKLKELFQSERIPSWRRRFWPMLTSGGKILWARGFGAAREFAAGENDGAVLRISETENLAV